MDKVKGGIYTGAYILYTYTGVAVKSLDKYQTKTIFLLLLFNKLIPGVSVHILS